MTLGSRVQAEERTRPQAVPEEPREGRTPTSDAAAARAPVDCERPDPDSANHTQLVDVTAHRPARPLVSSRRGGRGARVAGRRGHGAALDGEGSSRGGVPATKRDRGNRRAR